MQVLINNAATRVRAYAETEDGIEKQFAVDHLGHFLFTALIFPRILAARSELFSPRVIFVASEGHIFSPIRFDDVEFGKGKAYDKWQAYGQAKTANILTAVGLARKFQKDGVLAYSVHPGGGL